MTFAEYRTNHFRRLQKHIELTCWVTTIAIFIIEVVIWLVNLKLGFITGEETQYTILRVILPAFLNIASSASFSIILRNKNISERAKNYAACFAPLMCCTTIACVHCYYPFLLFSVIIPLYVCTIFGSKGILKKVSPATFLCTVLASICYYFEYKDYAPLHRFMSIFCLFALFAASVYICAGLVNSQHTQIKFINTNYEEQQKLIEELKIEPMTGLYNKSCFENCLVTYETNFREHIFKPTCCIIDIDHFKQVNDTYGHMNGDLVLKNLALIIKNNMGGIRRAFRFGGEEFVMLWENESLENIYKLVSAMKDDFCAARYDFAPDKSFSFSAGICKLEDGMTSSEWFENADQIMYKAKQDGRDRIYIFNDAEKSKL